MVYRFAQDRQDYSDFAAGKVFYGLPGHAAFPVRLASEIFQHCLAIRDSDHIIGPCTVYDPCCGGAYLLSTLAYSHWNEISRVIGSDIDSGMLQTSENNLALLTIEGLETRIAHINDLLVLYGKPSHAEALTSAHRLLSDLTSLSQTHSVTTRLFKANVLDPNDLTSNLAREVVDIVIADVPYGSQSTWFADTVPQQRIGWAMLQSLLPILSAYSVVAICADKKQKFAHEGYRRVDHFQIGKRRVVILRPIAA